MAATQAQLVTFNDDGAWSWFQDERALIAGEILWVGSVAAGARDTNRRGDIDLVKYDLRSGARERVVLHQGLLARGKVYDDHNAPAMLAFPDGRLLAVYAMHGDENRLYYRTLSLNWSKESFFVPSESSSITYSNLFRLSEEHDGRVYNFYRGLNGSFKPSYAWSDDGGSSWRSGNVVIDVPATRKHRPYVKYASNGRDAIHMVYTEGHPRDYDNSVYHVFYRAGWLHRSDGTRIRELKTGLRSPSEGTLVYKGDPNNVAWVSDLHLDDQGMPYAVFSVQKDSSKLPPKEGGADHRYRYARWDGKQWKHEEIAYAGRRLYAGEDDYTGNIALDPYHPGRAYLSANVDPKTGTSLARYEIFRAERGGESWQIEPVTRDSKIDNIRPIVPMGDRRRLVVLWLRGTYRAYTDYELEVTGMVSGR
jgi:hypothetical protein